MKSYLLFVISLVILSCQSKNNISSFEPVNWEKRKAEPVRLATLRQGSTYLSIYSEIYERNEHGTHPLASTVSMRNVSPRDTVFILKAEYFNTHGQLIRSYFSNPIHLFPLETVEIVINKDDNSGGTGANFIFDWAVPEDCQQPFFEAVMISTASQQGISFTTQGVEIRNR